jgi:EmrB/QacA subfamily drug resistance transporter
VSAVPTAAIAGGSRRILIVASLAAFMAFLDATIVNIAFPALTHAFAGEKSSSISWVLNAYNIIFAALLLPAGQLADRYSRRGLFLLGVVLFTAASGCCALAPTLGVLIAFRVIQAVGAAIVIPAGMALLLPAFSAEKQIKAIALLAAVSGVAFAAGPSIGGTLIHIAGWKSIFLINVPVGLLTVALAARPMGHELPTLENTGFPDLVGAAMMLLGVGALALAIVQGNAWGWSGARIIVSFTAATALVAGSIWRARRQTVPAVELDLFRAREFTVANISVFAFAAGLAAKLLCDVVFMTSVWRYSELKTGLAVSASPLITALVATTASRIAIRVGSRPAAAFGGALYAAGCLWYVMHMGGQPDYLGAYLPGTAFTGIGIAFILPTLTSTAMRAVPTRRLAAGAGINSMIRQLGAVLGVALFVAIVGTPTPATAIAAFHHGWALAATASSLAALTTLALRPATTSRLLPGLLRGRGRPTKAASR